jgi:outer membrane lipoprotein SlyB
MRKRQSLAVLAAGMLLTGCATTPTGPMVRVMPAPNKPLEVFAQEQADCEHYASDQVVGGAQAANNRALGATALGAVLGLGVGAATGSGRAATVGAATGGAIGAAVGANQSSYAGYSLQRRYDIAFSQCMYAKGNYVPGMMAATPPPPPPPRS